MPRFKRYLQVDPGLTCGTGTFPLRQYSPLQSPSQIAWPPGAISGRQGRFSGVAILVRELVACYSEPSRAQLAASSLGARGCLILRRQRTRADLRCRSRALGSPTFFPEQQRHPLHPPSGTARPRPPAHRRSAAGRKSEQPCRLARSPSISGRRARPRAVLELVPGSSSRPPVVFPEQQRPITTTRQQPGAAAHDRPPVFPEQQRPLPLTTCCS